MAEAEKIPPKKSETALREEKIIDFWREDKTFEKSLGKNAPRGEFVFYDGPPFATGLPHHGSLLSSIIKDVIPRYKSMRGYRVRRRWGWDCHGLPIETFVEKELGLKTKKDILDIGVDVFNEKARSVVLRFVKEWEKYVERVGRWVDFRNSYKTMDNSYIESVWWALAELWKKKLLYEGRKVLMYCPHCETPLAKAEIAMDHTYQDLTEEAVTVKFKVKNPGKHALPANTFLLAWTTTPWTLPGNVGLAVGKEVGYALWKKDEEFFIVAENLAENHFSDFDPSDFSRFQNIFYSDLIGLEYEPLYQIPAAEAHKGKKHVVLPADFVSIAEGTGIVHTAVMYGEEDFMLGQKEGLPMVQLLNPNGAYNQEAPEFIRGQYIKDAERDIKLDLENRNLLFEKKNHTHSYPHCYRCGTSLIYNAVSSWFINIQKVKNRMLSENEKVNWVPEHLKHGRFKNILENAPDWTISRNRFWASPLPIWKEKGGSGVMVVRSLQELKQKAKRSGNRYFVMRHGEAEFNVKGIVNSNPSVKNPLTEVGRGQALTGAKTLKDKKIDLVIASPLPRTLETAQIVCAELGLPSDSLITDERLREIDFGQNEGMLKCDSDAVYTEEGDFFSRGAPGGESLGQLKKRAGSVLFDLEARHKGKNIILVTHDGTAWLIEAVASCATKEELEKDVLADFLPYAGVKEVPFAPFPHNADYELDLHRPYIDAVVLEDEEGREYERIPEVVDCWVESGSMPFAELHYPFENKEEFAKRTPGDFIAEYIAQTRTWFYYTHALGVLLFGRLAFRNVVSTGTILAGDGEKLSKSKRNYTDPLELIDLYGSDALRFHLMSSPVMQAEDLRFRDEDVREAHNKVVQSLTNCLKFFELYKENFKGGVHASGSGNILDHWILARLGVLTREVTEAYERYDLPKATRPIKNFVEDYSTWYVRRSRERTKAADSEDSQYTLSVQREVLSKVALLIAPVMPFLAETLWRGVGFEGSVHLESWPAGKESFFKNLFGSKPDPLLSLMERVRVIVSAGLEARQRAGLKVRQPLSSLSIPDKDIVQNEELSALLAEEINVKQILWGESSEVYLDLSLSEELRQEGAMRDLARAIQEERKKMKLNPTDRVRVLLSSEPAFVKNYKSELQKIVNASELRVTSIDGEHLEVETLKVQVQQE